MRQTALKMVHELARRDPRVVFIGSDLGAGTLIEMADEFPDRFFMEGVSEANLIGMAAGLAMEGYIPYLNTIATFLTRRCYEQIAIDLCLQNLPVRLIASGGGMVYAPLGPTHTAIEDVSILRPLPNMAILSPCDAVRMRQAMECSLFWQGPMYFRLAKGGDPVLTGEDHAFDIGKICLRSPPGDVLIVATGTLLGVAQETASALVAEGVGCGVAEVHTIKPFDVDGLLAAAKPARLILTLEEHVLAGGLGSLVLETLSDHGMTRSRRVIRRGLPDGFPAKYGSQKEHLTAAGFVTSNILQDVRGGLSG